MSPRTVVNPEPLTLYTTPDPALLYRREPLLSDLAGNRLPRLRVDRCIAKVLPSGSLMTVEDAGTDSVRILECAYRPYFTKDLFAIAALVAEAPRPADFRTRPPAPPPERILSALLSCVGTRYLYGGSAPAGSPAQARFLSERCAFEPADLSIPEIHRLLHSAGIDCSGLFNLATDYAFFGDSKDVYQAWAAAQVVLDDAAGRDPESVLAALNPLDIILFRGHMTIAISGGRVIQAVGDGANAESFAAETGHVGPPWSKYDRVVVDDARPILRALMVRQGRRFSSEWRLDDRHFMILRRPRPPYEAAEPRIN